MLTMRRTATFPVNSDMRKAELHTLVPPSTQLAIVEHYLKVIAPKFQLISTELQTACMSHENPLKWSVLNRGQPEAHALVIMFAVSTALITRDDDPKLAYIASRTRSEVQKLSTDVDSAMQPRQQNIWPCTAMCALALCALIGTSDDQAWNVLGQAVSALQDLGEATYHRLSMTPDKDYKRLERLLLQLERYTDIFPLIA
jgi:hypothetical protein